jgi:ubiquitin C-terminal hydrolase
VVSNHPFIDVNWGQCCFFNWGIKCLLHCFSILDLTKLHSTGE